MSYSLEITLFRKLLVILSFSLNRRSHDSEQLLPILRSGSKWPFSLELPIFPIRSPYPTKLRHPEAQSILSLTHRSACCQLLLWLDNSDGQQVALTLCYATTRFRIGSARRRSASQWGATQQDLKSHSGLIFAIP